MAMAYANSPQAESFATSADITQAAAALQAAINAPDVSTTVNALQQVIVWLQAAESAFTVGGDPTYQTGVAKTAAAIAAVQALIDNQANWGDLATFQQTTLYGINDYLWSLGGQAAYVGMRDSVIDYLAILGFILGTYGAIVWTDYQTKHGHAPIRAPSISFAGRTRY
jgi:hypothetical protein